MEDIVIKNSTEARLDAFIEDFKKKTTNIERRFTQIAISKGSNTHRTPDLIYGLCNDGSLWCLPYTHNDLKPSDWVRLPSVPRKDFVEWELWQGGVLSLKYDRHSAEKLRADLTAVFKAESSIDLSTLEVATHLSNEDTGMRVIISRMPAAEWLKNP